MNKNSIAFWVCLVASVALFIGGFLVPPMGVIDGSVLKAGGMLLGFGALAQAPAVLESLERAKFTKGDITVEISKDKDHVDITEENC
jgi:hypothetical protein